VRLSAITETDFHNIINWTLEQFGDKQTRVYGDALMAALEALTAGSITIGVIVGQRSEWICAGWMSREPTRAGTESALVLIALGFGPEPVSGVGLA